jgi:hypothetical protein
MTKKFAIYLLRALKKINESNDYNDVWHLVKLLLANQAEVERQLEMDFHRSNKINSKKVKFREVGFIRNDWYTNNKDVKQVFTYCFDGNGTRRLCTWSDEPIVEVTYEHMPFDEIKKMADELKQKCLAVV